MVAGTLGGTKQSTCKITAPGGEFLFPASKVAFKDVETKDGVAELRCGDTVLTVEGWSYDAKKKKATVVANVLVTPATATPAKTVPVTETASAPAPTPAPAISPTPAPSPVPVPATPPATPAHS